MSLFVKSRAFICNANITWACALRLLKPGSLVFCTNPHGGMTTLFMIKRLYHRENHVCVLCPALCYLHCVCVKQSICCKCHVRVVIGNHRLTPKPETLGTKGVPLYNTLTLCLSLTSHAYLWFSIHAVIHRYAGAP